MSVSRTDKRSDPFEYLEHVKANAVKGDVTNVIDVIDDYCWNKSWHMNVGDVKGKLLDLFLQEKKPKYALELGSYLGYSGLRISRQLNEGSKLFTLEVNPQSAKIANEIFQFAGVQQKVTLLLGDSEQTLKTIKQNTEVEAFDFVFIDHWKDLYKRDLILLENLQLLKAGSVIVADNTIYPGCPDYLQYIRSHPKFKSESFLSKLEYSDEEDALEKSVYLG